MTITINISNTPGSWTEVRAKEADHLALANEDGRTLAHEAARWGNLPESFDQWDLADKSGWTVAHEAALAGLLPKGFNQWSLADKYERKVGEIWDMRMRVNRASPAAALAREWRLI